MGRFAWLLLLGALGAGACEEKTKSASATGIVEKRTREFPPGCSPAKSTCERLIRVEVAFEGPDWRLTEVVWRPLASELPILRYLPVGGTFQVKHESDNPRAWQFDFDHDLDETRNHLVRVAGRPDAAEAAIEVHPRVPARAGDRGYVPVRVSGKLLARDWTKHPELKGRRVDADRDPKRRCSAALVQPGGSRSRYTTTLHESSIGKDRVYIVDGLSASDSLGVRLSCTDNRIEGRPHLIIEYSAKPSAEVQTLGTADAKVTLLQPEK